MQNKNKGEKIIEKVDIYYPPETISVPKMKQDIFGEVTDEMTDEDIFNAFWEEVLPSWNRDVSEEKLKIYQDKIGLDYYNLDISDEDQLIDFIKAYIFGPALFGGVTDPKNLWSPRGNLEVQAKKDTILIEQDQPTYKAIVDAVIDRKQLSDKEMMHIRGWAAPRILQIQAGQEWKLSYDHHSFWSGSVHGMIRSAYQWLIRISSEDIEVKRCTIEGCNNIFLVRSQGKPQKYCSGACKAKAYRERKKNRASSA